MKRFVALCLMAVAFATAPAFSDALDKGFDAYIDGDYKTAFAEWKSLAEQGNARAQFQLAWLYNNGHGVPQDYKQAVKWLILSAEQGHVNAQFNLAAMYRDGEGVPQDYKTAVKWYRLSAEQGFAEAQNNLGFLYAKGQGVPEDYVRAHMWMNLAASNGDDLAPENRDIIAKLMTPAQIDKAQDLASECVANNYKGC